MSYLEEHRDDIYRVFEVLGDRPPLDDANLVAVMEREWLGTEHGSTGKRELDGTTAEQLWPLLEDLEVVLQVDPPQSSYDHVLVMGAAGIGLHRRLELVRTSGVRARALTVLAGMRPHSGLPRDGALDELLLEDGRFAAAPGWVPPTPLARQAELLAGLPPLTAAQVVLPSETDLARLLACKQWPGMTLTGVRVAAEPSAMTNELGRRDIALESYRLPGPIPELHLLNGAPVRRPGATADRPARPTSISTLLEWLELVRRPTDRELLVVVNQPHLTRVRLELIHQLERLGLDSLKVDVAGCAAMPGVTDVHTCLGEIPARINAERKVARK